MITRPDTKFFLAESFKELSQKKSVDKITVKEISKNCGLTAQTFYNYFHDKYELMAWIYSKSIEDIVKKIGKDDYTLKNSVSEVVKYFFDNRKFLKNLMMNTSGQNSFITYVTKFHVKVLLDYIKRSPKFEKLSSDMEIFVKVYCYGIVCTLCEFLIEPLKISEDELVKIFVNAIPEPLKKFFYKDEEK